MKKMFLRFYTIADFNEEEIWLRKQHQKGLKLINTVAPCFYTFEKCEPEDVIYKLDFKNKTADEEYIQAYKDYGWEYFNACMGWNYFRKPAAEVKEVNDGEIFSDNESKIEMLNKVILRRLMPIVAVLLCCVFPNVPRIFQQLNGKSIVCEIISALIALLFLFDAYICVHCSAKLRKLKKDLEK